MEVKIVPHNSKEYWQTVDLRSQLLRVPLGLSFNKNELMQEADSIHIAYAKAGIVVACLVLKPINNNVIKMRQVAVSEKWQGRGIGRYLVVESEHIATSQGFNEMILHARDTVLTFYEKMNYKIVGEGFMEVNIPHHKMRKELSGKV